MCVAWISAVTESNVFPSLSSSSAEASLYFRIFWMVEYKSSITLSASSKRDAASFSFV